MIDNSRPVTGYPAAAPAPAAGSYSYPYAAYPPNSATYYAPHSQVLRTRNLLLRRLMAAFLAAFGIALAVFFILWIVFRPRVPQFLADSLSVSSFNLTPSPNSLLTATWLLNLTVRNPNHKLTLIYNHLEASIFYRSDSLSATSLPPFVQPRRNETVVEARFAAAGTYVEGRVAEGMGNEKREKGTVEFDARLLARVGYRVGGWKARSGFLRVYCRGLRVAFSGNGGGGSMTGGPRQCRVGI